MTRAGHGGAREVTAALLAALTTYATALGWYGLSVDPSAYTTPILLLALGVAAVGIGLRSLRLPRPVVVSLQALLLLETLHVWWGGSQALAGVVPTPASLAQVGATLGRAVDDAQAWAAPVPDEAVAFPPLMILIGGVVAVLVDALAVTYRRPALSGLPLLAAFTMPIAVTGGIRWDHFLLAAAGFSLLLAAEHLSGVSRWGRPLMPGRPRDGTDGGDGSDGRAPAPLGTAAMMARSRGALVRVLAPALLLSLGGSMLVPGDSGLLGEGTGDGDGGQVRIENPITDLRRDLVQGPDIPLVFARTQDPDPSYLRISALDVFDGTTWRPSVRDLPPSQRLEGELPPPVGLGDDAGGVRYRYELSAFEAFDSNWLPLPFPTVAAEALGDWRYDAETRDVTTVDGDLSTSDLDYAATRLRITPTARELLEAFSPPVSITQANTDLPFDDDVPSWLQALVDEVTAGAPTDFERAVAIQRWFRDPANFTYSTDRESGNGIDDLRTFLTPGPDGREGYCEQFASAMAVMARIAGIPTRVAVGFLRPESVGPETWLYSAHDLHSWPEVFFAGSGWVRFEPTPASRAPDVPGYTAGQLPELDETEAPSPTAAPSSAAPTAQPDEQPTTAADRDGAEGGGSPWRWGIPLLLVLIVATLLAPRAVRARQRHQRTDVAAGGGGPAVEAAWAEVRAQLLDLGHTWPERATLRTQQRHLAALLARPPVAGREAEAAPSVPTEQAVADLDALVRSVERARFAAVPLPREEADAAWGRAQTVVAAMWSRTQATERRRARWMPRSTREVLSGLGRSRHMRAEQTTETGDQVKV